MTLNPGTRVGPYAIVGSLGAGGMGEVYRARDPRLDRDIALKVLPAGMAADDTRHERFTREARAIAALNHPHIVTIYSTEEADGVRFLTMELVEGQALDALIPPAGFPVTRFLELALPLADALTAAHQKQITHRDLKPANVMVASNGRVKVLDFGLALAPQPGRGLSQDEMATIASPQVTTPGTIIGTMPYMSPEQVEGRPLDQRTDLFSLGVMFHEMLTGSRPFSGDTSPQLMSSILRDVPPSSSEIRSDIPEALSRLVQRCLEKRPDDRVQTARDIYNELRHVQKQLESGPARSASSTGIATAVADSLWIAVVPFTVRGADPDAALLASGLTEDITAGLSRFSNLSVVAPQSAQSFRDSPLDARQIAERLNARYVIGGSVRKSASGIRITAHLIDARSGSQLWTETYDRSGADADIFAVQDDVTDRVVATVADVYGVLLRSMSQGLKERALDTLAPGDVLLRHWSFLRQVESSEHALLRSRLEQVVDAHPQLADAWAVLAELYGMEFVHGLNQLPESLARARRAVSRALDLDAVHCHAWHVLAVVCFFERDRDGFVHAAERAFTLNPRNTNTAAFLAFLFSQLGDTDRACAMTQRAMAMNPAHPGWYHFVFFDRHYMRGEFDEALATARKINMPQNVWSPWAVAIAAGQLGRASDATAALDALVALAPAFEEEAVLREVTERWRWGKPANVDLAMDGFRKAMALRRGSNRSAPSTPGTASSAASPGPANETARRPLSGTAEPPRTWIAVIPFASGSDEESRALADGLTEDITAGLTRFAYMSVVAAHSARQHKGTTADARQIGQALGARYLLDGGVRRAAGTMRIVARLVDAANGAQLWSETYTREVQPATVLAVQDDVTDRVVATVADVHGVLLREMSVGVTGRPLNELDAQEMRLRYWAYHRQHAPDEHGLLRDFFERRVEEQPAFAPFWSALAHLYLHEYGFDFNVRPEPLVRARQAVSRALELDAHSQHAWQALAFSYFFEHDREGFAHAVDRVLTLNPRNANAVAFIGTLLVHAGELERGAALATRAMSINPDHPGWYHFAIANHDYAVGNYEGALRAAKRINMPKHLWAYAQIAMAAGKLGRDADATAALDRVFTLAPSFADEAVFRDSMRRWKWNEVDRESSLDGYRKAVALRNAIK